MAIPDLTASGVLPPFVGAEPTRSAAMSPYRTTLVDVAGRFCGSDVRKAIFRGLLDYRQGLNAIGLRIGMQWLSGSFLEDIETLETRAPRDVDVVTFFHRPAGAVNQPEWVAFVNANLPLLGHSQVKGTFKVDVQFVDMNIPPVHVISQARFWYGLFSHRRNGLWKGLLEVPLAVSADDATAATLVAVP